MSYNNKFTESATITAMELVHDTHYIIRCNYHYIRIYLDPDRNCCENFGLHVRYKKKPALFMALPLVGAQLHGISIHPVPQEDKYSEMHERVVTLYTSVGRVYVTAYNEHNSYYPHDFEVDIHMPECKKTIKERL